MDAGSPWPEQEETVAQSCPWASPPSIVQALESTGGRGEDAIELLIAARNEPALAESAETTASAAKLAADTTPDRDGPAEAGATPGVESSPEGSGSPASGEGMSSADRAALPNGNGETSAKSIDSVATKGTKAANRVARASDCPCGSGLKYKKCCRKKDAAIARGQIAAAGPDRAAAAAADSSIANDLGSLVI